MWLLSLVFVIWYLLQQGANLGQMYADFLYCMCKYVQTPLDHWDTIFSAEPPLRCFENYRICLSNLCRQQPYLQPYFIWQQPFIAAIFIYIFIVLSYICHSTYIFLIGAGYTVLKKKKQQEYFNLLNAIHPSIFHSSSSWRLEPIRTNYALIQTSE